MGSNICISNVILFLKIISGGFSFFVITLSPVLISRVRDNCHVYRNTCLLFANTKVPNFSEEYFFIQINCMTKQSVGK